VELTVRCCQHGDLVYTIVRGFINDEKLLITELAMRGKPWLGAFWGKMSKKTPNKKKNHAEHVSCLRD